ncbi:MAG: amino acid permease [Acidobacteria bacterium]|nr:amino acid permease [Acidobacteriota bacterium]
MADDDVPGSPALIRLARVIGLSHATALVVGTILGASVFVQASEITARVPSTAGVVLAWLLAGALTLLGALVCAELASAYPRTGGVYVFLREIYTPALGFLWGWAMFWSMHSGIAAAIATVFARYAGTFLPLDDTGTRVLAVGAIVGLSAINYAGTRAGSRLQAAVTAVKVGAVALIIGAGWVLAPTSAPAAGAGLAPAVTLDGFLLAVSAGLFAFGGWHMVTYTAEETVEAQRTIPRALMLGIVVVTVCYVGLNAVYLSVLSLPEVTASSRVAADTFERLVGPAGAIAIAALVMVSAFGALNGIILVGPRVYYQMAQDGLLFRWAGQVHPRYQTPARAIVLQAVWSSVLVWTGTYRALFTRVIYTEWIFFALLGVGVLLLRRRPDYHPAWPMPLVPVAPLVFVAAAAAIVVNQLREDLVESAIGLGLVLSGLPVYWLWTRRAGLLPPSSS